MFRANSRGFAHERKDECVAGSLCALQYRTLDNQSPEGVRHSFIRSEGLVNHLRRSFLTRISDSLKRYIAVRNYLVSYQSIPQSCQKRLSARKVLYRTPGEVISNSYKRLIRAVYSTAKLTRVRRSTKRT